MTPLLRGAAGDRQRWRAPARRPAAAARRAAPQAEPGRRRHHRARDPQLAPGAGDDGPRLVGVHRPARAHERARAPRRARRARHAAAHVLARIVIDAWRAAPLQLEAWRVLQTVLHEEFSHFAEEAYHETNRWLVAAQGAARGRPAAVHPPLPPWRAPTARHAAASLGGLRQRRPAVRPAARPSDFRRRRSRPTVRAHEVGDETRMMTRAGRPGRSAEPGRGGARPPEPADRRASCPSFADTSQAAAQPPSPRLEARRSTRRRTGVAQRLGRGAGAAGAAAAPVIGTPALLEELQQRKQALKQAAATPVERATIEIVALLFQSILTEDAHPGHGAGLVRAPADAGAARGGLASPTSSPPSTTRRAA